MIMEGKFKHVTVLKNEMIDGVFRGNGIYVDLTLGGGGHSAEILKRGGFVVGIDRDEDALHAAEKRLSAISGNFKLVKSNFSDLKAVLQNLGVKKADGIMADLGVSSYQLDTAERGFSYMHDAPLDMRMDKSAGLSAFDVVNGYSAKELERVIKNYGEERWAKRIAEFIVNTRENKKIETTGELVSVIKAAVPKGARQDGPHPAKRTFQALRIEVNGELTVLEQTVRDAADVLAEGARMGLITFHSLEDRIVKNTFRQLESGCTCPPEFPVCVCGGKPKIQIITRKPLLPSEEEISENPRARSAKLRIAEGVS